QIGSGCPSNCNGRGTCDDCRQVCLCDEGAGASDDDVYAGELRSDCLEYACPTGKAWADGVATDSTYHNLAECSGNGKCDRDKGECSCFSGFSGAACDRNACPEECSGHGQCMSLKELAQTSNALPLSNDTTYGGIYSDSSVMWDSDSFFACVCDSSWDVGLAAGQTQSPEFFGPACSLRRCPSGDDPETRADETDCGGVAADGGGGGAGKVGAAGNLCHVDCSNRGLCDHETGLCACFRGYYGDNCGKLSALATWEDR
ncbi:unnamed protein product, partial [Phaeothamnion confervicola]